MDTKCVLAYEATESKGGHFAELSDFLLQKLQPYGEVSNVREAMAPLFPLPMHTTSSDLCPACMHQLACS